MATRMIIDPIEKFNLNVESITAYLEQIDVYLKVNKTEDNVKALVFINTIEKKNYTHLRNPLGPENSWIKGLEKLSDTFISYLVYIYW